MVELDPSYLGPNADLLDLMNSFYNSPTAVALSDDEAVALRDRLVAATRFEDLSAADQELLTRGVRDVQHGASSTWQDPSAWGGDWEAEDAARDRLGLADDVPVPLTELSGATGNTPDVSALLEAKDFDGWVGL